MKILSEIEKYEDQFSVYKKYLPIFTAYAFCVSGLYQWGFWSSFNVNIFQYIDIPGIIKNSLFSLLLSMSSFFLGLVFGHFMQPLRNSEIDENAYNSRLGRAMRQHWKMLLAFWIGFSFIVLIFGRETKWDLLSILIALPISIYLVNKEVMIDILPDRSIRITAVFFLIAAIPFSYSLGLRDAERIKSGENYLYVVSTIGLHDQISATSPESNARYLGQASDFGFFYNPLTEAVSISKLKPGDFLSLKHHKKYQNGVQDVLKWAWDGIGDVITSVFK